MDGWIDGCTDRQINHFSISRANRYPQEDERRKKGSHSVQQKIKINKPWSSQNPKARPVLNKSFFCAILD